MMELAERLGRRWDPSSWKQWLGRLGGLVKWAGVSPKVAVILVGLGVIMTSSFVLFHLLVRQVEYTAALLEIAGQQMTLSQKMAYQAYMIADGHDDDRFALQQSIRSFDKLVRLTESGGWVLGSDLPKATGGAVRELEALRRAWLPYRKSLLIIARGARDDPAVKEALRYVDGHSDLMLATDFAGYFRDTKKHTAAVAKLVLVLQLIFLALVVGQAWAVTSGRNRRRLPAAGGGGNDRLAVPGASEGYCHAGGRQAVSLADDESFRIYRTLASMPCGVMLLDCSLRVVELNEEAGRALGVSLDSLVESKAGDIFGTADIERQVETARESRQPVAASYFRATPAGLSHEWICRVTATVLPQNGEAEAPEVLLIIRDVTSEINDEMKGVGPGRGFRSLVDQAVDAVISADAGGRIIYANQAAERMFGWESGELVGRPLTVLMPEKCRKAHMKALERAATTGRRGLTGCTLRVEALDKRGRSFPVEMSLWAMTVGNARSFAAILRDVTDRQKAVEAVTRSEARFRSLSEQLPDAIVVQRDSQVVYVNPAAVRLLGLEGPEAVVGGPIDSLIWREDRGAWSEAAEQAASAQSRLPPRALRLVSVDGTAIDVEAVVLPIEFDGGPAIAAVFRDVRERKKLQAQLMHADRMASVGTLAAGIAHEINNPVGFVHSNLGALEKYVGRLTELVDFYETMRTRDEMAQSPALQELLREASEKRKALKIDFILKDIPKLIGRSKEGTERIKKIVSDLKSFARSDGGVADVDVNKTMELALNIAWNEIKYKAEVVRKLGQIPRVKGDSTAIGQVFLNILVNAAQAMKDKGTITVQTTRSNGSVVVKIADTGAGIPREHLDKIFDPFFTTKPPGKGTGLGLNIAYNIIRRHKGKIKVDSKEGEGTTFTIELPVEDAQ